VIQPFVPRRLKIDKALEALLAEVGPPDELMLTLNIA
jgi:hypothetical protein